MAAVRVPKTPPETDDSNRQVSTLLMSQIERLQQVVREQIQTEGQAAEYIEALTKRVWAKSAQAAPKALRRTSAGKTQARTSSRKKPRPRRR